MSPIFKSTKVGFKTFRLSSQCYRYPDPVTGLIVPRHLAEYHFGAEIQVPCRRFEDFEYRTRKSWSRARRVVGKAEILDKGQKLRFVVTNLPAAKASPASPRRTLCSSPTLRELYCGAEKMENRIKEAQQKKNQRAPSPRPSIPTRPDKAR